jgi:TRAP transporter TAXI family solute receptor
MKFILASVVAISLAGAAVPASAAKFLVVGGGSTTGVYYQVALNVCKLVNKELKGKGYNCIGRPALGSVFNINAIKRGLLNFGVAQSDRNWQAYNGAADWKGKAFKGLRSVFSVHPETVMLVARADSGIMKVSDIKGRRVNIGNPGSGQRGNATDILKIYGIGMKDIKAEGLQQGGASRALVDKKIDAFFYTIGVPWGGGLEIANSTAIDIVPVNTAAIKKLVADNPYYVMTKIPGGTYKGVDNDVETYAVKATFVTGEKESADSVYTVVKTIFENLDTLRNSYANFKNLQPKDMLGGLSAPLHPGAMKYYKEKGWLK